MPRAVLQSASWRAEASQVILERMATTTTLGLEVLLSREQIAERVRQMGEQITRDLAGEKLVMIGVLKGAAPFLSDLARCVAVDATFDFVAVKSYAKGSQTSSGAV